MKLIFDKLKAEDIQQYFGVIGEVSFVETSMVRDEEEYSKPKMLYQVKVQKTNL